MTKMLGHNNGPTMEPGFGWRKTAWTKARRDLLPTLPIEVLRLRVARAKALGLEYKTYASVRASTGRDVVGFLFSSNALGLFQAKLSLPPQVSARLAQIGGAARLCLAQRPVSPDMIPLQELEAAYAAPGPWDGWGAVRAHVQQALQAQDLPADGTLIIGATGAERDWSQAGRTAGYLSADRFFAAV